MFSFWGLIFLIMPFTPLFKINNAEQLKFISKNIKIINNLYSKFYSISNDEVKNINSSELIKLKNEIKEELNELEYQINTHKFL